MVNKLVLLQSAAVLAAWLLVGWLYPPLSPLLGANASALVYLPVLVTAQFWEPRLSVLSYVLGVTLSGLVYGAAFKLDEPVFLMHVGFALLLSALLAALHTGARLRAQQQLELELLSNRLAYHERHDALTGLLNRATFQSEFERRAETEGPGDRGHKPNSFNPLRDCSAKPPEVCMPACDI